MRHSLPNSFRKMGSPIPLPPVEICTGPKVSHDNTPMAEKQAKVSATRTIPNRPSNLLRGDEGESSESAATRTIPPPFAWCRSAAGRSGNDLPDPPLVLHGEMESTRRRSHEREYVIILLCEFITFTSPPARYHYPFIPCQDNHFTDDVIITYPRAFPSPERRGRE